jgi:hypothetical protein
MNTDQTQEKCETTEGCEGCEGEELFKALLGLLRERGDRWAAGAVGDTERTPYELIVFASLSRVFSRKVIEYLVQKRGKKGVTLREVTGFITKALDFMLSDAARAFADALKDELFEITPQNVAEMVGAALGIRLGNADVEIVGVSP